MDFHKTVVASTLLVLSANASAGVVFYDDFESYETSSTLNWDGGANWNVGDGSVDLVKSGDFGITCLDGSDYCVDLDGTSQAGGEFVSLNLGPLAAGDYEFSFWLSGSQRSGYDDGNLVLSAIDANDELSYLLFDFIEVATGLPWTQYTYSFTLAGLTNPLSIFFEDQGGDNVGALLDNVQLSRVPEPSVLALFGLGLLGMGAIARRRKQS